MQRRARRVNSNIFNMLAKDQIMELREAFNIVDINSDGNIDRNDLEEFLNSIGSPFSQTEIDAMLDEVSNSANFLNIITMASEKLSFTDSESDIRKALLEFDEDNDGRIKESEFRKWLTTEGDKLSHEDVDILFKGCVESGFVDCAKLTSKIKHGEIIKEDVEK